MTQNPSSNVSGESVTDTPATGTPVSDSSVLNDAPITGAPGTSSVELDPSNPFAAPSTLPFQLPDFSAIKNEHYLPAFKAGIAQQAAEIAAIVNNPEEPTWENVVEELERSGALLRRVEAVFHNLNGTDASPEFDAISEEILPQLTAHEDAIFQNSALLAKIEAVTPPADEESQRLHAHLLRIFARQGARLSEAEKQRLSAINERLSVLSDLFAKNLLASTTELAVEITDPDGLTPARQETARADAKALGREGMVVPLELPTIQGIQTDLNSAEQRERVLAASLARGENNTDVLLEMVRLRAERAQLLGYRNHAECVIEEETAPDAAAVIDLLKSLAPAAAANAQGEWKLLEELARTTEGDGTTVRTADWSYWENKLRARDYALDEEELKGYFPLDRVVRDGAFYAANRLYGITVEPRDDLKGYAPDVDVWEVKEESGESIGLFITDYYGRPSKRGGAWMSSFVSQSHLLGTKPVIVNVMGIAKPADGSQPLLTLDQVVTVFHEFGHALHGLLSDVRYPSFAGTNVPRDYVEFPSQINENWALDPAVAKNYAHKGDQVISDEMLAAISASREFGQGFGTSEYLAAAIIDLAWHTLTLEEAQAVTDVDAFEEAALREYGLIVDYVEPRYKSRYFNHIFASGYSAGYYSYLWAEALDADGFDWFASVGATGDAPELAAVRAAGERFRDLVLSKGASRDYNEAFATLRGRDKDVTALLRRRGLLGTV